MNSYKSIAGMWFLLILIPGLPMNLTAQQTAGSDTLKQAVAEGRLLFTGKMLLSNGGPACISCHTLDDPSLPISGGSLAIDITSFGALPTDALQQRITEIPFAHMILMKGAFKGHPVTMAEANKIIAYLKQVSEQETQQASIFPAGLQFLWVGLAGLVLIVFCIWALWHKRKRGSVNKRIYQRQIQSV